MSAYQLVHIDEWPRFDITEEELEQLLEGWDDAYRYAVASLADTPQVAAYSKGENQ